MAQRRANQLRGLQLIGPAVKLGVQNHLKKLEIKSGIQNDEHTKDAEVHLPEGKIGDPKTGKMMEKASPDFPSQKISQKRKKWKKVQMAWR